MLFEPALSSLLRLQLMNFSIAWSMRYRAGLTHEHGFKSELQLSNSARERACRLLPCIARIIDRVGTSYRRAPKRQLAL